MKRYVVKNEKNKTYKNMFGVTDYDIPMFGFKSALLIIICENSLLLSISSKISSTTALKLTSIQIILHYNITNYPNAVPSSTWLPRRKASADILFLPSS